MALEPVSILDLTPRADEMPNPDDFVEVEGTTGGTGRARAGHFRSITLGDGGTLEGFEGDMVWNCVTMRFADPDTAFLAPLNSGIYYGSTQLRQHASNPSVQLTLPPTSGELARRQDLDPIAASRDGGWPSFFFDGVTTSSRVYWPLGTAGNIGAGDFTLVLPVRSLSIRASGNTGLFTLTPAAAGGNYTAGALHGMFFPNGIFRLMLGSDGDHRRYDLTPAQFFNLFQGQAGDLVVRRANGVMSLDWLSGRTLTSLPLTTEITNGTPPAWSSVIDAQFLTIGAAFSTGIYSGELGAPELINRAWSTADLSFWSQHRLLPPVDRLGGNMQLLTPNQAGFENGTEQWSGVTISGTRSNSADFARTGTRSLKITNTGAAGITWAFISEPIITAGNSPHDAEAYIYVPSGQSGDAGVLGNWSGARAAEANGTGYISTGTPVVDSMQFDTWMRVRRQNIVRGAGSAGGFAVGFVGCPAGGVFYIDDVTVTRRGAVLQSEITQAAQVLDHGPNRIRGIVKLGVRPFTDRDPVPIRDNQAATGFALGIGASEIVFYEPGLITGLRIKQSSASAQTITLRLNTSGGTVIATATTAASTDWQTIALSIPGGFEVNAGDRLHWTITNALDWDLVWSRR